jgi:3-oxoacyl-[acyl-carrier protein] reductase
MNGYISGATGYLGRLLANHFIGQTYSLTLAGRNITELETLRNELLDKAQSKNLSIKLHTLDFDSPETISQKLDEIDTGNFDWCINAVGQQGRIGPDSDLTLSDYSRNLAINVLSPIELTRHFTKKFSIKKRGKIIHFSGGGSSNARPFFSPYAISKTALARYIENTSYELKNMNIQIFSISPGMMPSKMLTESLMKPENLTKTEIEKITSVLANQDNFDGGKILDLLDFLLSDAANFCSGRMISAQWDNWHEWPQHQQEILASDLFTLRRVIGRDRGFDWGDV